MVRTLLLLVVVMTVLAVTWADPNPAPSDGNGFQPFRVVESESDGAIKTPGYSEVESAPHDAGESVPFHYVQP